MHLKVLFKAPDKKRCFGISPKIVMVMKLTCFLMLVGCLQVSAAAFGQKVTITGKQITLKQVFKQIREQTGYNFIYSNKTIREATPVTLDVKDASVQEALNQAFDGQPLSYIIEDKIIIVSKRMLSAKVPSLFSITLHPITGSVRDSATGNPLVGVTVKVKGSAMGTVTDTNGEFSLDVTQGSVLLFSYLGYNSKEITIDGETAINVALSGATTGLNQLVVIGYGTREKENLTGAISTISGNELAESPVANLSNALAGAIPGLIVNTRSGEPGEDDATIFIRGKGTLGSTSPLVVIDGVPDPLGGFERLDPSDIQSFTIIKDATGSIYGARAANGVILITTKRGTAGQPVLSFNTNLAFTQPTRLPKMLNSYQYAQSVNEYDNLVGQQPTYTPEDIQEYKDGSDPLGHPNTNWWKTVMRTWSPQTNNVLSLRGGTDKVKYYLSGELLHQNSMYKSGSDYYTNKNARINLDINATNSLKIGLDVSYRNEFRLNENPNYGNAGDIFYELWNAYPYLVARYPDGKVGVGIGGGPQNSMVYVLNGDLGSTRNNYNYLEAMPSFNWDLSKITKGLYLSGYYSYNLSLYQYKGFNKIPPPAYSYDKSTKALTEVQSTIPPDLSISNTKTIYQLSNIKLGYKREFGKNSIEAFISYEQSGQTYTELDAYRTGFLSNEIPELFAGSTVGATNNSTENQTSRVSYISRLSYNYANKYLIDYNMRFDGSSNFPPGKRFGFFPALSAAWRVSQESFFHSSFINDLKLRGSWGLTGNDAVNQFQYIQTYLLASGQQSQYLGAGYFYGPDATQAPSFTLGPTPNINITWEVASTTDLGLDAQLFNNFSVTVDVFRSMRSHILIPPTALVPTYTGITLPDENLGKVLNHGIELDLSYNKSVSNSFSYYVSGNATFAINKVVYEGEPASVPSYQRMTGHPIDSWLLYQAEGLFQDSSEVNKYPHPLGSGLGDIRYKDVNGDGVINALDEVRSTESETPQIMFGATVGGKLKNFDVTLFFQGQARAKAILMPDGLNMAEQFFTGRWLKPGDNKYPRTFNGPTSRTYGSNTYPSTFWLLNDAFLRFKNVEVGYNFPKQLLNKIKIQKARIYVNGNNLFSIDDWGPSFDPESPGGNSTNGRYYPQLRVLNVGLNVTF